MQLASSLQRFTSSGFYLRQMENVVPHLSASGCVSPGTGPMGLVGSENRTFEAVGGEGRGSGDILLTDQLEV